MSGKFIFVVGGVISGTGKGVSAASVGLLLKARGLNVTLIKFDPYLNVNAGILAPREHGECFLCDDGTETDLDLGHYERIAGITVSGRNICTSGTIYKELIDEQERGEYLGETVQIVPHVTDKIKKRLTDLGKDHDVVIAEIGGTVGDSESFSYFEALKQFVQAHKDDCLVIMVAPILWVGTIKEFKTKPLQNSVRDLQTHGLTPDIVFCRSDRPVPEKITAKIASVLGLARERIFEAPDVPSIYQVPLEFYNRHVDDLVVDLLRLGRSSCRIHRHREVVEKFTSGDLPSVEIGVFGKYENAEEAYISLKEALVHGGVANDVRVEIRWINAAELEGYKDMRGVAKHFSGLDGIVVPGGFDMRGVEGKIRAIQYARERKIPFLGLCLGLQCAVIEFARNVCGMEDATSTEFNAETQHPVVHFVEGQESIRKKSGTMRLGAYDCELTKNSLAMELYRKRLVSERHRHRYEVNAEYVERYEQAGFIVSGRNPDTRLVEIMELDRSQHPFFLGTQAHPEFRSRLTEPAPLFSGLIAAAIEYQKTRPAATKPEV